MSWKICLNMNTANMFGLYKGTFQCETAVLTSYGSTNFKAIICDWISRTSATILECPIAVKETKPNNNWLLIFVSLHLPTISLKTFCKANIQQNGSKQKPFFFFLEFFFCMSAHHILNIVVAYILKWWCSLHIFIKYKTFHPHPTHTYTYIYSNNVPSTSTDVFMYYIRTFECIPSAAYVYYATLSFFRYCHCSCCKQDFINKYLWRSIYHAFIALDTPVYFLCMQLKHDVWL